MTVTTRRLLDLTIDDHTLAVPLVWGDDADTRTIDVHATVVTREGGGEAEAGDGGAAVHGWQCERRTGKIVPRARAKVGSPDA